MDAPARNARAGSVEPVHVLGWRLAQQWLPAGRRQVWVTGSIRALGGFRNRELALMSTKITEVVSTERC